MIEFPDPSALILVVRILFVSGYDTPEKVLTSLILLITMINCGALLEQWTWIFYLEHVRLFLIAGLLSYELQSLHLFVFTTFMISVFVFGLPIRKWYWRVVYESEVSR